MSGYISCGDFFGEERTGSAFFEVIEDLIDALTEQERPAWKTRLIPLLREQLDQQDEEGAPIIELSTEMMQILTPPLERYIDQLLAELGNPEPETWHTIGEPETGQGWRLLCADDLLQAWENCRKTGKPVIVEFE